MVILESIEIENFKSFSGKFVIGPLLNDVAVVGAKGSGKTNFTEAILFALGAGPEMLRVKDIFDVVHDGRTMAYVKLVYKEPDEIRICFLRSIDEKGQKYLIDDQIVTQSEYTEVLKRLGVNVDTKNFLISQQELESLAMKHPEELTEILETVASSSEFKAEYDHRQKLVSESERLVRFLQHEKNSVGAERKEAKFEKGEVDEYKRQKGKLDFKEMQLLLCKLFFYENSTDAFVDLRRSTRIDLTKNLKVQKMKKGEIESQLIDARNERVNVVHCLANMERLIEEVEIKINKLQLNYDAAEQKRANAQLKLEKARNSLNAKKQLVDARNQKTVHLEKELAEADNKKRMYKEQLERIERSIAVPPRQCSARFVMELICIECCRRSEQGAYDYYLFKQMEIKEKIKIKRDALELANKRLQKAMEYERNVEESLEELRMKKLKLIKIAEREKMKLYELDKIQKLLDDSKYETDQRKNNEIIKLLKNNFSGVYGRLGDMCNFTHNRYKLAATKVMGKDLQAIVVDTVATAQACIRFLNNCNLCVETFLPLDYVQYEPLKEDLRLIRNPEGVKLLYDVISYQPDVIKPAVLHATHNALVCETPEDAENVVHGNLEHGYAISLDGTIFQRSGLFTGEEIDPEERATVWDKEEYDALKSAKTTLLKELRKIKDEMLKLRSLLELDSLDDDLMQALGDEMENVRQKQHEKSKLEADLEKLEKDLENNSLEMQILELTINDPEPADVQRARDVINQINEIEDVVFSDRYNEIIVESIRKNEVNICVYETWKINILCGNLIGQLMYERSRKRGDEDDVNKWEKEVENCQNELVRCEETKREHKELIEQEKDNLNRLTEQRITESDKLKKIDKKIRDLQRFSSAIKENVDRIQNQIFSFDADVYKYHQNISSYNHLLEMCKVKKVRIPMLRGTMHDIEVSSSDEASSQESTPRQMRNIEIDYSSLTDDMKQDIEQSIRQLEREIQILQWEIRDIKPNFKSSEIYNRLGEKVADLLRQLKNAQTDARKATEGLEWIKVARRDKFMQCYKHVSQRIDEIYKTLAKDAKASLVLIDPEEPYNAGVEYTCTVLGMEPQTMLYVSHGERMLALLALSIALQSFSPAPFVVFDDIDASVDEADVQKVADLVEKLTTDYQCFTISQTPKFYLHCQQLIGICCEPDRSNVSRILTINSEEYLMEL